MADDQEVEETLPEETDEIGEPFVPDTDEDEFEPAENFEHEESTGGQIVEP